MHKEILHSYGFISKTFYLDEFRIKGSESNSSRLARLCWKYQIPPTIFFNHYLKSGSPVTRSFFKYEAASHLNSYTNKTIKYEKQLNILIGLPPERCFSYSYLNPALDKVAHGFMAPHKKWCPACYRDRLRSNSDENGVFDDLYWSVNAIKTCLLHGYALRDKCPKCFSLQPYISTSVEPGYCHHCLSFLGDAYEHYIGKEELESQRELFTLFYLNTYDEFRPEFNTFIDNLKALKQAYPGATSKYLGDAMGVSDDVVKKWLSGRRKPRLETLFLLQKALGLYGPHQLFYRTELFIDKVLLAKSMSLKFNTRCKFAGMQKAREIKEEFELIFSGELPTMSRSALAEKYEVSEGFLTSRFSFQCEQLSLAHEARLAQERAEREKNIIEQLALALGKVRSRKRKWTLSNAISELKDPRIIDGIERTDLVIPFEKAKQRLREIDRTRKHEKALRKWETQL